MDKHDGPRPVHDLRRVTMPSRRDLAIGVRSRPDRMEPIMTVNIIFLQPLIALVAGILILIMPRLLNYIVAIYLILVGLSGLLPQLSG